MDMRFDIFVRPDPPGRYTAVVFGIPEVRAEAETEVGAVQQAYGQLRTWLSSARHISAEVADAPVIKPIILGAGQANAQAPFSEDDPEYREYVEEIRRFRQEVDERFRQEVEERACPNSSSTPIT
jgi:hypothetical protein